MSRTAYLGELELVVMLALDRLPGRSYGMDVYDEIVTVTKREISAPTVYVTLSRLEKKEYVSSSMGEPSPTRGGRSKKYYRIAPEGRRALNRSRRMLEGLLAPERAR